MEDVGLWIDLNVGVLGVIVAFLAINAAAALMIAKKQSEDEEAMSELRLKVED